MPAPEQAVLITDDDVRISAVHLSGTDSRSRERVFVVAHGFTGSWRRPAVGAVMAGLRGHGGVLGFDFRGHGSSAGLSTVGDREVRDLEAVLGWARRLGYRRIVTVGFSMGGSVVLRHAALYDGVAAVVAVSAPARWYYRGTPPMRRVHFAIERPAGRVLARFVTRTRISPQEWNPVPLAPFEAAAAIAPTPLLVVHGDNDPYFPLDHPRQIHHAARAPKELWIEPGLGHAENAVGAELLDRIGRWARTHTEG
ncbi:alpha/beta hydrolase family protein [Embleya sp. NBC_00896]|uniref:alpha/beta hydrolase family protein n=1 Tax=Embleya sp. NBC_00896 TaxID=2975961 RepID=UPI00386EE005|nr:alpha/beta hydrolase [Embleya sp. NBC_00896]